MRIWIVGREGMLGSAFCRLLKSRQIPYFATEMDECDITDFSSLQIKEEFTHLINCSGYTAVDLAESEKEKAYRINVEGVENLAHVAGEKGAKVVHFSTDYIFDGRQKIPYTEENPGGPLSVYGKTKWEGEKALLNHAPNSIVIRTSWLFGPGKKNFVTTMLKLMEEGEELKVVNDQIGRPTYTEDLAEVTLALLRYCGIFHFANGGETSWHGFAEAIWEEAQSLGLDLKCQKVTPIPTKAYKTPAERPKYSVLSTMRIEELLAIEPRPWREALSCYMKEALCSSI